MNRRRFFKACGALVAVTAVPFQWAKQKYQNYTSSILMWNTRLTDKEVLALYNGADPDSIRPECRVRDE